MAFSQTLRAYLFLIVSSFSGFSLSQVWPSQSYVSEPTLHPPVLSINKTGPPLSTGSLFLAPNGRYVSETSPLIMDDDNNLVWNGPAGLAPFNFGVQTYRGEPVLVYWNGTVQSEPIGRGYGEVTLLNSAYEIIANVTLSGNFVTLYGQDFHSNIDLHELFITPKDTLLVTANNVTITDLTSVGGPKSGWVVDSQVYEIDIATNEVIFSWSALDHLKSIPLTSSVYPLGFAGYSGTNQSSAWGYSHINAVAPYESGYLLSFRYLCAGIALDSAGNVKWILQGQTGGNFKLDSDAHFCYQHDIRATLVTRNSLTISMHDNANSPVNSNTSTTPSSGLILDVNLTSMTATLDKRFQNPKNPIFSTAQGNFQRLANNNVLVGHGIVPYFEEFEANGSIAMTVQFAPPAPQGAGLSYRVFRQPWVGCPLTQPSIFARVEDGTIAVYLSWNGATEYSSWVVYAGVSATNLTLVATAAKTGFETRVELVAGSTYVQAQAVMATTCKCKISNGPRGEWSPLFKIG